MALAIGLAMRTVAQPLGSVIAGSPFEAEKQLLTE